MDLRDIIIAVFSVPLSDRRITKELNGKAVDWKFSRLKEWLLNIDDINALFSLNRNKILLDRDVVSFQLQSPQKGRVGIKLVDELAVKNLSVELHDVERLFEVLVQLDVLVIMLCGDTENDSIAQGVRNVFLAAATITDRAIVVMEPEWTTSILIENIRPFFNQLGEVSRKSEFTPYFEKRPEKTNNQLSIHRVEDRLQFLLDAAGSEPILPYSKLSEPYKGTALLCTTFLPPVSYSLSVVDRFYKNFGVTESIRRLILETVRKDSEKWFQSIAKYQRYDIIDRDQLELYFLFPDYYQLRLTHEELSEQVQNVIKMIDCDNYSICLTPEAVDIAFEVQKPTVRIRTDRRNKAKPRAGRISRIEFNDVDICDTFEREFWHKYRSTENDFKDKEYIKNWLLAQLEKSKNIGVPDFENEFRVTVDNQTVILRNQEVYYMEAVGNFSNIFCKSKEGTKKLLASAGLKELESIINPDVFIRIHRGYIINRKLIRKIQNNAFYFDLEDDTLVAYYSASHRERLEELGILDKYRPS